MLPLKQKLIVPRSSLTTTTTASVSSVMPSAARCRDPSDLSRTLRVRHREKDARLRDAQVADDDGAVVELVQALRDEEADEELALHRRVDGRPLPDDELVEVRVLLERDERADAVSGKLRRGGDDLVDDLRLLLPRRARQEGARADAHEAAPDVVLEDDDDDQDDRREQRCSRS